MNSTSAVAVSIHAVSPLSRSSTAANAGAAIAAQTPAPSAHLFNVLIVILLPRSERLVAGLARADSARGLEIGNEDLAVADRARRSRADDRLDRLLDERVRHGRLDLGFRHEVHRVFRSSVQLGMAFLPPESLHLRHREALNARLAQCLADVLELERLDDRRNQFHGWLPVDRAIDRYLLPNANDLVIPKAMPYSADSPSSGSLTCRSSL